MRCARYLHARGTWSQEGAFSETPGTAVQLARRRRRQLRTPAPAAATILRRYFKTAPGEYGTGERFLGIRVPVLRRLARAYEALTLGQFRALLASSWQRGAPPRATHPRPAVRHRRRGTACGQPPLYLKHTSRVTNWDLVDASAVHIVAAHRGAASRPPGLARSGVVWERRIAITATFHDLKRGLLAPPSS